MAGQCIGEDQTEHLGCCTSMRQASTRLGVSVQEKCAGSNASKDSKFGRIEQSR
jgi:hypothetical protein